MKRRLALTLAIAAAFTGCREPARTPMEPPDAANVSAANPEESPVAMSGSGKWVMFDEDVPPNERTRPTFEVRSPRFSLLDSGAWRLESPEAIIAGAQGEQAEVTAKLGQLFDEPAGEEGDAAANRMKKAVLTGNVVMTVRRNQEGVAQDAVIEMADMTWLGSERLALTDNPLTITESGSTLHAEAMRFAPGKGAQVQTLELRSVTGTVGLADAGGVSTSSPATAFSGLTFDKPAPAVYLVDGRVDKMSGGVALTLQSEGGGEAPLRLSADEIRFSWSDEVSRTPNVVELIDSVHVKRGSGEDIRSNRARLDLEQGAIRFTENVHGSLPQLARFDADEWLYDLNTGDGRITNLRAKDVPVGASGQAGASATPGFSSMDVRNAPVVELADGTVKSMRGQGEGRVDIVVHPDDPAAKPMEFQAKEVTFERTDDGTLLDAIRLRDSVRVVTQEGTITANQADMHPARRQLIFVGDVRGSMPKLSGFTANRIIHNMDSGETTMTALRADDIPIRRPGEAPAEASAADYTNMDLVSVPKATMKNGQFQSMTGNPKAGDVVIRLRAEDPQQEPVTLRCREVSFAFEDPGLQTPTLVEFRDNVSVQAQEGSILAERADLNLAEERLAFFGNVRGDMPDIDGAVADQLVWDLKTGTRTLIKPEIPLLQLFGDADPQLLAMEDIRSWSALIAGIQTDAAGSDPSPGKRLMGFLDATTQGQFMRLPTDRELDTTSKEHLLDRLNRALDRKDFYERTAWQGVELIPEAATLLARDAARLSKNEQIRLNRLLLQSAYPTAIAERPASQPATQ